jgi:hypothetical protein
VDVSISLTAAATSGHYVGYWILRNSAGVLFSSGDKADKAFYDTFTPKHACRTAQIQAISALLLAFLMLVLPKFIATIAHLLWKFITPSRFLGPLQCPVFTFHLLLIPYFSLLPLQNPERNSP